MDIDKNILSIDSDDDDKDYLAFSEFLENDTQRKKKLAAKEITQIANDLVEEIERKKRNQKLKIKKLIPFILKNCDQKYTEEELINYSYNDVQDIYNELKEQKQQSSLNKFFRFIFNL